jgi:uncharacterized protein DUF1236
MQSATLAGPARSHRIKLLALIDSVIAEAPAIMQPIEAFFRRSELIVELVPEFRGYDYFVLGDEIVIVDPSTRRVAEIIEDIG